MKRDFWSLHLPVNKYYGIFPRGFVKKVEELGVVKEPFVHLCSGTSDWGSYRFDINKESQATHIQDARNTGLPDEFAEFVMLDPYYTEADFGKVGQDYVSVYDFLKEAMRICKVGGHIAVLHTIPPKKPKGTKLVNLVAISMGPDRQFRCFQVFQKINKGIS